MKYQNYGGTKPIYYTNLALSFSLVILLIACPSPSEKLNPTICDDGYHPCGDDSQYCCLDTTNHDFSWEIDTLGDYASWINDFAIISKDDIWAVGKIESDSGLHNLARWDGSTWRLEKTDALYHEYLVNPELRAIKVFSQNDIWVVGGSPIHWDGVAWTVYHLWDMGVFSEGDGALRVIWGSSPDDIYFAGSMGSIAHYDGNSFSKLESGVDTRFVDISGSENGEYTFIVGYNILEPRRTSLIQINSSMVTIIYDSFDYDTEYGNDDYGLVSAVGVHADTAYIVSYKGLVKYAYKDSSYNIDSAFDHYNYSPISVVSPNDIFLNGFGFKYAHFNGSTWSINEAMSLQYSFASISSEMNEELALLGGWFKDGSHAVIGRGYR